MLAIRRVWRKGFCAACRLKSEIRRDKINKVRRHAFAPTFFCSLPRTALSPGHVLLLPLWPATSYRRTKGACNHTLHADHREQLCQIIVACACVTFEHRSSRYAFARPFVLSTSVTRYAFAKFISSTIRHSQNAGGKSTETGNQIILTLCASKRRNRTESRREETGYHHFCVASKLFETAQSDRKSN